MKKTNEYLIKPEDDLLRRIPLKPSHINQGRITSACFKTKPGENGLSVDIEKLVEDITRVFNEDTHTLARLKAGIPMDLGYDCIHDPTENNYAHGLIAGDTNPVAKKSASMCKPVDRQFLKKF